MFCLPVFIFVAFFCLLLVLVSSVYGTLNINLSAVQICALTVGFKHGDLNAQFSFFQVEFFIMLLCMT